MIHEAMKAIAEDLNAMLQRQRGDSRDRVILSNLSNPGGAGADEVDDKICFTLTQITEEKNTASVATPRSAPEAAPILNTPVCLNLHVLFAAQYSRYEVGLEMISQIIAYLHNKPDFTVANTPKMSPGLDRLTMEMVKITLAEQSYLWGMLGSNYTPSALYSMRILTFGGDQIQNVAPTIGQPAVNPLAEAEGAARH